MVLKWIKIHISEMNFHVWGCLLHTHTMTAQLLLRGNTPGLKRQNIMPLLPGTLRINHTVQSQIRLPWNPSSPLSHVSWPTHTSWAGNKHKDNLGLDLLFWQPSLVFFPSCWYLVPAGSVSFFFSYCHFFCFLVGGPGTSASFIGTLTGKAQRAIVVLSIGKLFRRESTLEIVFSAC